MSYRTRERLFVILLTIKPLLVAPGYTRDVREVLSITGELKVWHKITLTLVGPQCSETSFPNPFLSYRLQVRFTGPRGQVYAVPGYFAADGDAANTSAQAGDRWRVHFAPDEAGTWTFDVSMRQGMHIAVKDDPLAGSPVEPLDGLTGSFEVGPSDKTGRDFRAHGRLEYVGKHHLRFAGTGEYFLKCGADAPENLLAYADFDGSFKKDGHKDHLVKTWEAHVADWEPNDPTWQDGKGNQVAESSRAKPTVLVSQAQKDLTLNLGGFGFSTTYYWRVDTIDGKGSITRGDVWKFMTAMENRRR